MKWDLRTARRTSTTQADDRPVHIPQDNCLDHLATLDDWQRGFMDAVFASQNISAPTPAQCSAALKRMTSYVMQKHGGELPPDGRVTLAKRA
jgi:hypothetical protein